MCHSRKTCHPHARGYPVVGSKDQRRERAKAISQKPSVSVSERFDCNGLVVVKPFALFNLIVHQLGDT